MRKVTVAIVVIPVLISIAARRNVCLPPPGQLSRNTYRYRRR